MMHIYKLNAHGREVWSYPIARLVSQTAEAITIEAIFQRPDYDMGYVVLAQGDRFVEHFYADRWYNVFAVYQGTTPILKGWYCNICRPATWTAERLDYVDLALDCWVWPDGRTLVLDEDEFAALSLTAEERAQATAALNHLQQLAADGQLPR
jgi:predicted RNA-binding protein associated with RNAse of E/G family